jgi:hypothetical protein
MAGGKLILVLVALAFLAGCRDKLADEKADEILKDLAVELAQLEKPEPDAQIGKVQDVCKKHGVQVDSFAIWLKDHADSQARLATHLQVIYDKQIEERRAQLASQVRTFEEEGKGAVESATAEALKKKQEIEAATRTEVEKLETEFKAKELELQKALEEVRNQ